MSRKRRRREFKHNSNHVEESSGEKSNFLLGKLNLELSKKQISLILLVLFIFVMGFYTYQYHSLTNNLVSIPSCLYGCDYYYENGMNVDYFLNPTHTWQSSSNDWLGPWLNTLPKGDSIVKAFLNLFTHYGRYNYWKNSIVLGYLGIIFGLLLWFFFFYKVFEDKLVALVSSVVSFKLVNAPYFKYSGFINVMLPLVLLFFFYLFESDKVLFKDNKLLSLVLLSFGVLAGVILLNYNETLIVFLSFLILFSYYYYFFKSPFQKFIKNKKLEIARIKEVIFSRRFVVSASVVILIYGLGIFLLKWWYYFLFVLHGKNNAFKFDVHPPLTIPHNYFSSLFIYLKDLFFVNFSFYGIVLGILIIIAFFFLFVTEYNKIKRRFLIYFWTFIWSVFNFVILIPILKLETSPSHSFYYFYPLYAGLMVGYSLLLIKETLPSILGRFKSLSNTAFLSLILFVAVLASVSNVSALKMRTENRFWQAGLRPIPPQYQALKDFFNTHRIDPNKAVFLSNNELSFALHGIFAAKTLVGRQSHFFTFGDFQKLWLDASIIFYSNNLNNRYNTLKKYYDIASKENLPMYLYWDYSWEQLDWTKMGNKSFPFDTFRFEYSPKIIRTLDNNGINYTVIKNICFEPSGIGRSYVNKMNVVYVSQSNFYNSTNPWNPDLNKYLHLIWEFKRGGVVYAKLYKVELNSSFSQ